MPRPNILEDENTEDVPSGSWSLIGFLDPWINSSGRSPVPESVLFLLESGRRLQYKAHTSAETFSL